VAHKKVFYLDGAIGQPRKRLASIITVKGDYMFKLNTTGWPKKVTTPRTM